MASYQALGQFISTFAEPDIAGFEITEDGLKPVAKLLDFAAQFSEDLAHCYLTETDKCTDQRVDQGYVFSVSLVSVLYGKILQEFNRLCKIIVFLFTVVRAQRNCQPSFS